MSSKPSFSGTTLTLGDSVSPTRLTFFGPGQQSPQRALIRPKPALSLQQLVVYGQTGEEISTDLSPNSAHYHTRYILITASDGHSIESIKTFIMNCVVFRVAATTIFEVPQQAIIHPYTTGIVAGFDSLEHAEMAFHSIVSAGFKTRSLSYVEYFRINPQLKAQQVGDHEIFESELVTFVAFDDKLLERLTTLLSSAVHHGARAMKVALKYNGGLDYTQMGQIPIRIEFSSVVQSQIFDIAIQTAGYRTEWYTSAKDPGRFETTPIYPNGSVFQWTPFNQLHVAKRSHRSRPVNNIVNIWKIRDGQDVRTTAMIRNLPNKMNYYQLKGVIDGISFGRYDFLYLRVDFKTKSNVGYAFINFARPEDLIPFVQQMSDRTWPEFDSEKSTKISYATIQGRDCLVAKFRNSSVMNEEAHCRPHLYYTYDTLPLGEELGAEEPFPRPDNVAKLERSIQNAKEVGLFPPKRSGHRDEGRNRRSDFDRGNPNAALEAPRGFPLLTQQAYPTPVQGRLWYQ